jgi:hypothetical protein
MCETTDNCYASETELEVSANQDILDNCGPIGLPQTNDTDTYQAGTVARIGKTSKASKTSKQYTNPEPDSIPLPKLLEESANSQNYLIN